MLKKLVSYRNKCYPRGLPKGGTDNMPDNRHGRLAMTRTFFFLAMCLPVAAAFAAQSQVYKWTDAQGVVHYSDAPPPTSQANVQQVRISGGDRPRAIEGDADATASKPADAAPPETKVAEAAPPANSHDKDCANARSNLELLQSKFQVSVAGSDGKAVALDDKARQAQIADMNAQIATYCK
jgi:hypothetical protein